MRIASLAEVKARLSAFLAEAETSGPVIITRNGKAVAVLVAPADDDDLERLVMSRSPQFQALLDQSRQSIAEGKGLSHDEFWRQVEAGKVKTYEQTKKPARVIAEKKIPYKKSGQRKEE
jgi:prevent-host-death family protein